MAICTLKDTGHYNHSSCLYWSLHNITPVCKIEDKIHSPHSMQKIQLPELAKLSEYSPKLAQNSLFVFPQTCVFAEHQ